MVRTMRCWVYAVAVLLLFCVNDVCAELHVSATLAPEQSTPAHPCDGKVCVDRSQWDQIVQQVPALRSQLDTILEASNKCHQNLEAANEQLNEQARLLQECSEFLAAVQAETGSQAATAGDVPQPESAAAATREEPAAKKAPQPAGDGVPPMPPPPADHLRGREPVPLPPELTPLLKEQWARSPSTRGVRDITDAELRAAAVKQEFLHAWRGYVGMSWGHDELHPYAGSGTDSFHMALTLVDGLDTAYLMGLDEQVVRPAVGFIRDHLRFPTASQKDINLFETTIRVFGGLLSAYALSGEQVLLERAQELGQAMAFAFRSSRTHFPKGTLDLQGQTAHNPSWCGGQSTTSELGTLQLEWASLSLLSGQGEYKEYMDGIVEEFFSMDNELFGKFIHPDTKSHDTGTLTMGARVDSIYEYFWKYAVLLGCMDGEECEGVRAAKDDNSNSDVVDKSLALHRRAMHALFRRMISVEQGADDETPRVLVNELEGGGKRVGKMDHLVCFLSGLLALSANQTSLFQRMYREGVDMAPEQREPPQGFHSLDRENPAEYYTRVAEGVAHSCFDMYLLGEARLAPEIVRFDSGGGGFRVDPHARHNLLRPETVESLFIMHRVTGDPKFQEMGWEIFKALVSQARVPSERGAGYSSIKDVQTNRELFEHDFEFVDDTSSVRVPTARSGREGALRRNSRDKMESFFLSETLKYLYLLFSPEELLPLDRWVFNTEAHPLPIIRPGHPQGPQGGHTPPFAPFDQQSVDELRRHYASVDLLGDLAPIDYAAANAAFLQELKAAHDKRVAEARAEAERKRIEAENAAKKAAEEAAKRAAEEAARIAAEQAAEVDGSEYAGAGEGTDTVDEAVAATTETADKQEL